MSIVIEAEVKCDAETCTETAKLTLTRDHVSGGLTYTALPPGWRKEASRIKELVYCPDHSSTTAG